MRYLELIENRIEQFINEQDKVLQEPIAKALKGGKRLRPLVMMAWRELEGGKAEDVLDAALGIELIHSMSCVHDDIIDKSLFRHNMNTLWFEYDLNTAICVGDVMLSQALNLFNGEQRQIVNNALIDLIIGQLEPENPENAERYYKKTSALFAAACKLGAIEHSDELEQWGLALGISYQAADDLLDNDGLVCISKHILDTYLPLCALNLESETDASKVLNTIVNKIKTIAA